MSKDVKYSFKHGRQCPVKTKKNTYSCKKDSCLIHMWLCSKHKTENKDCMEKFATQLRSKSGITLVFQSTYKEPKHTAIDSNSHSSAQSNLKQQYPLHIAQPQTKELSKLFEECIDLIRRAILIFELSARLVACRCSYSSQLEALVSRSMYSMIRDVAMRYSDQECLAVN